MNATPQNTINSYAAFQQYFTQILKNNISTETGNDEETDSEQQSPHGAFWNTLTYDQFVNGNVPKIGVKILIKGNSAQSNFILALRGQKPFDGSRFQQMPADGPPYLTEEQIAPIAAWIDAGCPQ